MRRARDGCSPSFTDIPRRALPALLLAQSACARRTVEPPPGVVRRGLVVLLRGLTNVFSTGMDRLATRLASAGYRAKVGNHLDWLADVQKFVAVSRNGGATRPLAAVGHSLGADDAIRLAGAAGAEGLALDLLVTFDPVHISLVPPGPRNVLNFFLEGGLWGRPLDPGPGFEGSIENIPVTGMTHFDIDKSAALHARVLEELATLPQRPT